MGNNQPGGGGGGGSATGGTSAGGNTRQSDLANSVNRFRQKSSKNNTTNSDGSSKPDGNNNNNSTANDVGTNSTRSLPTIWGTGRRNSNASSTGSTSGNGTGPATENPSRTRTGSQVDLMRARNSRTASDGNLLRPGQPLKPLTGGNSTNNNTNNNNNVPLPSSLSQPLPINNNKKGKGSGSNGSDAGGIGGGNSSSSSIATMMPKPAVPNLQIDTTGGGSGSGGNIMTSGANGRPPSVRINIINNNNNNNENNFETNQGPPRPKINMSELSDSTLSSSSMEGDHHHNHPPQDTAMRAAQREKDYAEASEIRPWLFLGGEQAAKSKEVLQRHGITYVLNTTRTMCDNYHEGDDEVEYVRSLDLIDSGEENISHFWFQTIAEIERVRKLNGKILVHCHQGVSRSATLVIAYLMWADDLTAKQAFRYVKERRSVIQPNMNFMIQLEEFEKRLKFKPDVPTLHRVAPHSSTDGTLVVKLVIMADGSKRPVVPNTSHLDPRGAFLLHSPKDRTMYLWVGPDVGVAAATEAAARQAARAASSSSNLRRASSASVKESYLEAGRRMGRMMCQFEPAYRGCDLVQVPMNLSAKDALAEGADHNSLAARFWRTLGENVGSKVESLRGGERVSRRWSQEEEEGMGLVKYLDSMSDAHFDGFSATGVGSPKQTASSQRKKTSSVVNGGNDGKTIS
jgi:protein-tyrosine phosphatase